MKAFQTLLYYKYCRINDAEKFAVLHLNFCKSLRLKGRILVSEEGINGTVSGPVIQCKKYMDQLKNDPIFHGIEFKIDEVDEVSFDKMHVRYKSEIVNLGCPDVDPTNSDVPHLSASEVLEMKDKEDVVMLDVRNKVEYELGKFKDALTLDIDTFREFPEHLNEIEEYKDKKIIAYCTGGIRCEKATLVMKNMGFKNVYQIDGGIFKYGREAGGRDFEGKMYVFDKRLAVDVNDVNPKVISKCRICDSTTSKMVNCANPECNEHFVLCEDCGWKMKGCCSDSCLDAPNVRPYDGSGYYSKGE
ncbi:MAG: rhodanese-related sulfurtransferase [Chitinophagales bacterium]|nr:rhodanese-related sulfurtransferase [Chitinophagales bacterium]